MVKPRRSFYNVLHVLTLAVAFALTVGCGGKPATPPPGAEETPATDVELGDVSNSPSPPAGEPTPSSPAEQKPPADESGTK
jgi:hypothetical protein